MNPPFRTFRIFIVFLICVFVAFNTSIFPVRATPISKTGHPYKNFDSFIELPEYPGGGNAWKQYLDKNLIYPPQAIEQGVSGRVALKFRVREDGTVYDIRPYFAYGLQAIDSAVHASAEPPKKLGAGTDEEAVRLLANSGKWKPGIKHGKPTD